MYCCSVCRSGDSVTLFEGMRIMSSLCAWMIRNKREPTHQQKILLHRICGCLRCCLPLLCCSYSWDHILSGSGSAVCAEGRHTNAIQNSRTGINISFVKHIMLSFLQDCLRKCVDSTLGSFLILWFLFVLFCTTYHCTNIHCFVPRDKIIGICYNIVHNIMKSGTHYYPSPRVACTESESVSLAQICTLSSPRSEPRRLTRLYCHWCSKCFEKTRAHSLRVAHVSCLPLITSCMLLQNTCEIM